MLIDAAAVSIYLADLGLHDLPAAVCGLHALPAAVLLDLANLHGLGALPAVVCLADLVGGNTCWHAQLQVPLPRMLSQLCALNLK